MEVYKVYSDAGFTDANLNRPALNELLEDIKERKIDVVIVYKIDRLTRSSPFREEPNFIIPIILPNTIHKCKKKNLR